MTQTIKEFIQNWAKENGYNNKDDFWDFFYDLKPDIEDAGFYQEDYFDDWYDNEFFDIAKPIMIELFGYTEEDIEYV